MTDTYTALTFAPVQGFIASSRKLRDLYGSSILLSYLACALCEASQNAGCELISPAAPNVARGTPNQILLRGHLPTETGRQTLQHAWRSIVQSCRIWLERQLPDTYHWRPAWDLWSHHAWEYFCAHGPSINDTRRALAARKQSRAWIGINWSGESSSLSGADAIAWPQMSRPGNPRDRDPSADKTAIDTYYETLSQRLGEAILSPRERLSIPELIKRLIAYPEAVVHCNRYNREHNLPDLQVPETFRDLDRHASRVWTGWFMGDGDRVGNYLQELGNTSDPDTHAKRLKQFSAAMLQWGEQHLAPDLEENRQLGRIIYAGGDDFLGVCYQRQHPDQQLAIADCLTWLQNFPALWQQHGQPIAASVGFVWAGHAVPQRDVLQHCRDAEQAAKAAGRDRLALRILFNNSTHLEWICPWWFLPDVLPNYRDRRHGDNWTHLYNDLYTLQQRRAFHPDDPTIALALFKLYFGAERCRTLKRYAWQDCGPLARFFSDPQQSHDEAPLDLDHRKAKTWILGDRPPSQHPAAPLNTWIANLAQVGFHLHRQAPAPTLARSA